ncbi:MAG: hypothetical protein V3U14_03490 [candidate division NC10 bacterium]
MKSWTLSIALSSLWIAALSRIALRISLVIGLAVAAGAFPVYGQELYVPNFSDHDVSVLDAETLSTIVRIPVSSPPRNFPEAVAFSPDGRFAFVTIWGNEVVVIDTLTRTVTNQIPVQPPMREPQIFTRPGGDRMYISDCTSFIKVLDVATQQQLDVNPATPEIDSIVVPDSLASWAMGFTPDGLSAYASKCSFGPPGIFRIDLTANVVDDFIATPTMSVNGVEVAPNGEFLIGTGENFVVVVDLVPEPDIVVATLNNVNTPGAQFLSTQGVEFSEDSSRAYVVDFSTNKLHTVDVTTPSNPQLLSSVQVVTTGNLWELEVVVNRAYLVAFNFFSNSQVIAFDISTDTPVQLGTTDVGVAAFEIGLQPQAPNPIDLLTALIGELPGIVADLSTDRKLADKLEDTIGKLQDALGELTESPPDNKKALRKIEGAVKKLKEAIKKGLDPAEGTEFMDQLAEIARQIAVEALNEAIAQGGRPKKINDAQKALAKGDALRATGKFNKAVAKYREALKEAERSLT